MTKNRYINTLRRRLGAAILTMALLPATTLHAQQNEILSPRIASLQVVADDDWLGLPIIELGSGSQITIAFDDLTHEYCRYTYQVEHCESDWTKSDDLFTSDFIEGFSEGETIDDLQESLNTNVLYTHYALQIPNKHCQLKLSGNYRVTILDENNDSRPVLTACFMVLEQAASLTAAITTNTDAGMNTTYQQLAMELDYRNLRVTNPEQQIQVMVMQNARTDNAVVNPKAQYVTANGMRWDHCRDLIFNGGNEYRKFESLDTDRPSMGIETMSWDGNTYHAWLWPSEPRPNYVYDEDANGAFLIRNSDNINNDTESEYVMTHFTLKSPRLPGRVYLNGRWTNGLFLPDYQMEYDADQQQYEASVMLKQGYYSYQYLWMRDDGTIVPVPSEGNFFQTENKYQILVYYKGIGERTFRLVAYREV